jgi:multimeric flavodoxin WrbA
MMAILSTGSAQKIDEINLLTIRVGENNNKLTNTSTPVANAIINDWKTSIYHISFDFSEHAFHPCKACTDYCSKHLECVFDDGMQILRRLWLKADGVLWMANTPNDFMHPSLVSFFDRMNQVRFESYFSIGMTHMSRYAKAVGVIVSSDFNASTANTVRFIRQTALQYQNVILPLPFIERNTEQKNLRPDIEQADISMRLNITANQLSALAATLKSGLRSLKGTLPEEYYPSLLHFGRNAGKEEMVEN